MPRIAYLAILSVAAFAAAPGSARETAEKRLSAAVESEMAAQGPIVTAEDRALIARKCGYGENETWSDNVNIGNHTLHCANGKRIPMDDELHAMSGRISERANRHVERAMKSAKVARATSQVAREATERALKEMRRSLKQR
ncbi:hypothetical protein [Sphingomonas koreensis]|uniref:hypothetical protein n=1 Tax=Sphingomonas koreensis TaxID=93064 RepID=UPI000A53268D|nr:hypothetical protein [Sphingomonas koreensis]PJI90127.1 hypothetical protein BDW16_3451 [Sphingomonas koreensis]